MYYNLIGINVSEFEMNHLLTELYIRTKRTTIIYKKCASKRQNEVILVQWWTLHDVGFQEKEKTNREVPRVEI
jgi:hypothetical protein